MAVELTNTSFEESVIAMALKYEHCYSQLKVFYKEKKMVRDVFSIGICQDIFEALANQIYFVNQENVIHYFQTVIGGEKIELKIARLKYYYEYKTHGEKIEEFLYMVDELRRLYVKRKMQFTGVNILEETEKENVLEKLQESRKEFFYLEDFLVDKYRVERSGALEIDELKEELIKRRDNPEKFIKALTFIDEIDEAIDGATLGELVMCLGDTGVGKSIFLNHVACNNWLKRDLNVVFVSLEMPLKQIQTRIHSNIFEIMYRKIRRAELLEHEIANWEKQVVELKNEKKNFFDIVAGTGFNTMKIEDELNKIQDNKKKEVDLLLVDYFNIMTSNKQDSGTRRWDVQGDIVWEIKDLITDFNNRRGLIGFSVNQKGGSKEKGRLTLDKWGYSKVIKEACNVIIAMEQWKALEIKNEISWVLLKSRDSEKQLKELFVEKNFDYMSLDKRIKKGDI